MKTWNADTVMTYFLLYFRFAKSLRLHLVAILDSCKIERPVQFDGIFVLISIANFNPHAIALITIGSSMTSDLGACRKWLIFNESYLELIHPSIPYRDSRHSKVTVSPGDLDTKIAVIFRIIIRNWMWSTYMAMLSRFDFTVGFEKRPRPQFMHI